MRKTCCGAMVVVGVAVTLLVTGCGSTSATVASQTSSTFSTTTTTEAPATWLQVPASGETPSARCYQGAVYDSTNRKVIMFAGVDGDTLLKETWSYDATDNVWSALDRESEEQPSSAKQMPAVYDPTRLKVICFAGSTWEYRVSDSSWGEVDPEGDELEPALVGASMVRDEKTGKIILFGGTDMSASYAETWSYDPDANMWTNLSPSGEVPPGRSDAGMVYDAASGKIILFGGIVIEEDFDCLDDTWVYDPAANTWTQVQTASHPDARSGVGLAYDPRSEKVILFGGIDSELTCYDDTWAFDSSEGTWTDVSAGGTRPQARAQGALVYAADVDELLLFGGLTVQADAEGGFGALVYLDDVWSFGTHLWVASSGNSTSGSTPTTSSTSAPIGQATLATVE